jgi:hypothetical protein
MEHETDRGRAPGHHARGGHVVSADHGGPLADVTQPEVNIERA